MLDKYKAKLIKRASMLARICVTTSMSDTNFQRMDTGKPLTLWHGQTRSRNSSSTDPTC